MMQRTKIIDKLTTVSAALSNLDLVPVMTHFWFTGTHIMAFNDQIAISTPCKTEFVGAVPGSTLLNLLKASRAKEVDIYPQGNDVIIKAGSSRLRLAYLTDAAFIFKMPKPSGSASIPADVAEFLEGIKDCLRSVSKDTSVSDQLGVTVMTEGSDMYLFATNSQSMTRAHIKLKGKPSLPKRVVLSTPFCEELLRMAKGAKKLQLEIYDDHALFAGADGDILFGRLIEVDKPLDFVGIISAHVSADFASKLVEVPTSLEPILSRACVITDGETGGGRTVVSVEPIEGEKGMRVRFKTKSDIGEASDSMRVVRHPKATVVVEPRLVKQGLEKGCKMLITDRCFILHNGRSLYLVAPAGD